jgi:hypothetical protein
MTVVVNELDVAPADRSPAQAAMPAPTEAHSAARAERMVEQASRLRSERSRRLKAC